MSTCVHVTCAAMHTRHAPAQEWLHPTRFSNTLLFIGKLENGFSTQMVMCVCGGGMVATITHACFVSNKYGIHGGAPRHLGT